MKFATLILMATVVLLGACKPKANAGGGSPPPPTVTVARPVVKSVTPWDEYTGRLEAVEDVEVKAQVSGYVESVTFKEGALVHEGDVLLTIDSRLFQAQLDSAKADVLAAQAKVQLAQATLQHARADYERALKANTTGVGVVSAEELDDRKSTVDEDVATVSEDQAAVGVSQAAVKSAQDNVDWCKVTAPITGVISSKRITSGNMLTGGPGQTTVITTIKSVDPIYCIVNIDEASVLQYQRLAQEKKQDGTGAPEACYMERADETGFPRVGTIDFMDNAIDPSTGTRVIRGLFPNKDGLLLPGNSVRFRVPGKSFPNALLVIDDAVGTDQDRRYVYVVYNDHTFGRQNVTVGPLEGELRVITSGLTKDDLVIVNGGTLLGQMPQHMMVLNAMEKPMPEHRLAEVVAATAAATQSATPAVSQTAPASAPATMGAGQ